MTLIHPDDIDFCADPDADNDETHHVMLDEGLYQLDIFDAEEEE